MSRRGGRSRWDRRPMHASRTVPGSRTCRRALTTCRVSGLDEMVIRAPGSRDATSCLGAKEECKGASAVFRALFDDHAANLTPKIIGIYVVLIVANVAAWAWALAAFRHYPVLLGTALLAYGFGLRHAVDADHIAAIDNVTRKLMQEGKR